VVPPAIADIAVVTMTAGGRSDGRAEARPWCAGGDRGNDTVAGRAGRGIHGSRKTGIPRRLRRQSKIVAVTALSYGL